MHTTLSSFPWRAVHNTSPYPSSLKTSPYPSSQNEPIPILSTRACTHPLNTSLYPSSQHEPIPILSTRALLSFCLSVFLARTSLATVGHCMMQFLELLNFFRERPGLRRVVGERLLRYFDPTLAESICCQSSKVRKKCVCM